MKNKFLAFLLVALMLMTTCSVSATKYVASTLPETGILVFDDFEGDPVLNNDNASYRAEIRGDGLYGEGTKVWHAFYDPIATKATGTDHGTTAFVSADKVGANGSVGAMYYNSASTPFGKTTINTGRTLLSYDIYIPGGKTIGSKDIFWFNTSFWGDNGHKAYPITVMVSDYDDGYGEIYTTAEILFQTAPSVQYHDWAMADNKTVRTLDTDTWYDVDMLLDYETGTVTYYLDGNYVDTYLGSSDYMRQIFEYNEIDFAVSGGVQDGNAEIWLDNVKIERLGDDFGVTVAANTANTIDVKLDYVVDDVDIDALTPSNFTVEKADGSVIGVTSITKVHGDTLRFALDADLVNGANYTLTFGETIAASWLVGNIIEEGSKLNFATAPAAKQETILYENNFNNYGWVDGADAKANADFDYYWGIGVAESDWGGTRNYLASRTKGLERAAGDKYINFMYQSHWPETRQGLHYPFKNISSVSTGKLVAEFDIKISDAMFDLKSDQDMAQYDEIAIGFRETGTTKANFLNKAFMPGSIFMYYPVYDGYIKGDDADGYNMRSVITANNYDAYKFNTKNDRKIVKAMNMDKEDEWHTYKIEVDLDNNCYDIYRDGLYLTTSNMMPGNRTDKAYSAFVIGFNGYKSLTSADDANLGIDNLTIKNVIEYPVIKDVEFVKYDGANVAAEEIVSAGTKKVNLMFSTAVDADVADYITVSTNEAYSVNVDGKVVTVEFDNCLTAGETYTITVAEGVLANAVEYTFTADAGEIVFAVPSVKEGDNAVASVADIAEGDSLVVELPVINTAAEDASAWIVLAGYAGNKLVSVSTLPYTLAADGAYSDTATLPVTVDANLAAATTVKAFVFDGITKIEPIADPIVIGQ